MSHDPEQREEGPEGWSDWGASWRAAAPQGSSLDDVDLAQARRRADRFAWQIRFRNAREIAAGVLVVVCGVGIATHAPTWLGVLGGVAMSLGGAFVSVFIVLRARTLPAPAPTAPTREVLAHERAQLERQARLLERVWIWYLAPLVPSVVLIYAEGLLGALGRAGTHRSATIATTVGMFAGTLAFFALIGWMNVRVARKLRERMAKLPPDTPEG